MLLQSLPETFSCKRLSMTIEVSHCKPHGLGVPPAFDSLTPWGPGVISWDCRRRMWWTSPTGWERCCPAPSFPQGRPQCGRPEIPRSPCRIPSRIAKGRAQGSRGGKPGTLPAISLHARGQGIVTCSICFFFCVFFHGKVCLMKWLNTQVAWDWPTCRFGSCGVHIRLILIVLTLLILFWSDPNWSFAALWGLWACQLKSPGIFRPRLPIGPWIFLTKIPSTPKTPPKITQKSPQKSRKNSPKIPHRMVEWPGHFSMLRLNLRSETGQPLTTFRQPPPLPSSLDEAHGKQCFFLVLVDVYFTV